MVSRFTSFIEFRIFPTGASGFVGAAVADAYVKAGFNVRGTVRSPAKGDYLKNLRESPS